MAGAGDSRSWRWTCLGVVGEAAARRGTRRGARRPWRRRDRGPRRRAGPRSRGGSAYRSYEVVDPGAREVPQYRRSQWTSSRGCSSPHATATAPRSLHAVRASQADVWRLARHLVGPDDADDVTQDTFVRAWKALPTFRGDSSARTWLLSIARRACADAVRRTVRRRRLARTGRSGRSRERIGHDRGPGRPSTRSRRLVDELPGDQRAAFVLTQIVGCSYAEAAEACGSRWAPSGRAVGPGPRAPGGERCAPRRPGDPVAGRRALLAVALAGGLARRHRDPGRRPRCWAA